MNSLSLRILAIGLAALSLALAGCGGDADTSTPSVEQTTEAPPEASGEGTTTGLPAQGATTLTAEQWDSLFAELNEIALEEDNLTNGKTADTYRKWADPLAEGECKQALLNGADTWDRFTDAEVSGDSATAREIGGGMIELSEEVEKSCAGQ
jgi:hypothetical protein